MTGVQTCALPILDVVDAIAGVPLGGPGPFPGKAPLMPVLINKVAPVN